jgi:hypothetical protein
MPATSTKINRGLGRVTCQARVVAIVELTLNTLRLFQKVIIGLSIGVRTKKRNFAIFSNHTHFALLTGCFVDRIKTGLVVIDQKNGVFASKAPFFAEIAYVCDMLMRAVVVGLVDTSYVIFFHEVICCRFDFKYPRSLQGNSGDIPVEEEIPNRDSDGIILRKNLSRFGVYWIEC